MAETLPRLRPTEAEIAAPDGPLWLEVGFGGGEHAIALIAADPRVRLIASEVFENGICSMLGRLVPEGGEATASLPPGLRVWDADARALIRRLPDCCVERLFLMFPDPWPKARHVKRRFVHPATIVELARVMAPGGIWRIASDDPTYQAWVDAVMANQDAFAARGRAGERPDGWPPTRYEAKARAAGRTPVYWTFQRGSAVARRFSDITASGELTAREIAT